MNHRERQRLYQNTTRVCKAKGCTRARFSFSGYCGLHTARNNKYGWEEGRRIMPKEYESQIEEIKLLLQSNPNHEGIQLGLKFFKDWIDRACSSLPVLARKEFQELYDRNITPEELLINAAALWLYSSQNPWALPDYKPLTYALAINTLTMAHNKKGVITMRYIPIATIRKVGLHIRNSLGTLFMQFVRASKELEKEKEELRRKMDAPIKPYITYN